MTTIMGSFTLDYLLSFMFTMLRPGAMLVAAPLFSARSVPIQVRIGLAAVISVFILSVADVQAPEDPLSVVGLLMISQEILIGLIIGFILQIAFAIATMAGDFMSWSMGLGFATIVDPNTGVPSPTLGRILLIFLTIIFLYYGGHVILIEIVLTSYSSFPPGMGWLEKATLWKVVSYISFAFSTAFLIAFPIGVTLFLVNLTIGFISRSSPQLNLFAVGFPLTIMVGLLTLMLCLPVIGDTLKEYMIEGLR